MHFGNQMRLPVNRFSIRQPQETKIARTPYGDVTRSMLRYPCNTSNATVIITVFGLVPLTMELFCWLPDDILSGYYYRDSKSEEKPIYPEISSRTIAVC